MLLRDALDRARTNLRLAYRIDKVGREETLKAKRAYDAAEKARDEAAFEEKRRQWQLDWVRSIGGEEERKKRKKAWNKNWIDRQDKEELKEYWRAGNKRKYAKKKAQRRAKEEEPAE